MLATEVMGDAQPTGPRDGVPAVHDPCRCPRKMRLRFTSPHDQHPGVVASLLKQSYADLVTSDREHWEPEVAKWDQFDREVFEHPATVGACVFLSWSDDQLVGVGSFDPRQKPEFGIVGHNCVLPAFRGHGFGKQQIQEILQRFRSRGIRTAKTSTLVGAWHAPAQRMYLACGFRETGRHTWGGDPSQTVIEYEMRLDNQASQPIAGKPGSG